MSPEVNLLKIYVLAGLVTGLHQKTDVSDTVSNNYINSGEHLYGKQLCCDEYNIK